MQEMENLTSSTWTGMVVLLGHTIFFELGDKFLAFTESLRQVILQSWDGLNLKFYQSLM